MGYLDLGSPSQGFFDPPDRATRLGNEVRRHLLSADYCSFHDGGLDKYCREVLIEQSADTIREYPESAS
jgi:hypothetical protein